MDNIYCNCGKDAVLYCACQPATIYLCGMCVAGHLSKPGNHGLLQIGMDIHSIARSMASGRIVEEFCDVMSHLQEVIEKEEAAADSLLESKCRHDMDLVQNAYNHLRDECRNCYRSLKSALDTVKLEAKGLGNAGEKVFSPPSLPLIQACGHLLAKESGILPVATLAEERVKVNVQGSEVNGELMGLIRQWGLGDCTCERCKKYWEGILTTKQAFDMEQRAKEEARRKEEVIVQERKRREDEERQKAEAIAREEAKSAEFRQLQESQKTLTADKASNEKTIADLKTRLAEEESKSAKLKVTSDALSQQLQQCTAEMEKMRAEPPPPPPWWGHHGPPPGHHGPPPGPPPEGGWGPPPHHGGRHGWGRHHGWG